MFNGQLIPPRLSMNSDRFDGKHTEIPCGGFIFFLSRGGIAEVDQFVHGHAQGPLTDEAILAAKTGV